MMDWQIGLGFAKEWWIGDGMVDWSWICIELEDWRCIFQWSGARVTTVCEIVHRGDTSVGPHRILVPRLHAQLSSDWSGIGALFANRWPIGNIV